MGELGWGAWIHILSVFGFSARGKHTTLKRSHLPPRFRAENDKEVTPVVIGVALKWNIDNLIPINESIQQFSLMLMLN